MSSKSRATTAAPPHANLYCASCNSQIGIFENNWAHLTSHYAYPKEKGTDFGTQTGTNTQVVPHGTNNATATGCAMAQVFCKKCSALLGQCCKSAAKPEQKYLVNLVFYKTSRTYLKDAQTFASLEFNYPDEVDELDGLQAISRRSSAKPQNRRSSDMKPPYTPLRDSLPPAMSQPQSSQSTRPLASSITSATPTSARPRASAGPNDLVQDATEHSQMIQEHSQQLKLVETRVSRSLFRLNELEEKMGDLAKRRVFAVKHVDDQAAELEQHALQLSQHEAQFQAVKRHDQRLSVLESQLGAIKDNIDEMRAMFKGDAAPSANTANVLDKNNFVNGLEAMLQAFRNTQVATPEVEILKQENRMLKERLDTITRAMGAVSKDNTIMLDEHDGHDGDEQPVETLGKRKRQSTRADTGPRKSNSRRVSSMTETAIEQEQLPTPLSDRVDLLQSQKQLQEGLSRPSLGVPNLAGPYFGATLLPPMIHTEESEGPAAKSSKENTPENIDFSDDEDDFLLVANNKSQLKCDLPKGTSRSRRASTRADHLVTLPLPNSIRSTVEKLNGRMSRQEDAARKLVGETSPQADKDTSKLDRLPPRKPNGRRPVPPGKWAKVRQTSVNCAPDAPYATKPVFSNGRPRKSLPVQSEQSTSPSTRPVAGSGRNTPASGSDDEDTFDGESEDVCTVCEKGGKLLCCDACPKVYHHRCLVPKLNPKERIKGDWHCPACVSKQETTTTIPTESEQQQPSTKDQVLTEKTEEQGAMEVPESSAITQVVADEPDQKFRTDTGKEERGEETEQESVARRELLVSNIMRHEERALQDAAAAEEDADAGGDTIHPEAPVVAVIEV